MEKKLFFVIFFIQSSLLYGMEDTMKQEVYCIANINTTPIHPLATSQQSEYLSTNIILMRSNITRVFANTIVIGMHEQMKIINTPFGYYIPSGVFEGPEDKKVSIKDSDGKVIEKKCKQRILQIGELNSNYLPDNEYLRTCYGLCLSGAGGSIAFSSLGTTVGYDIEDITPIAINEVIRSVVKSPTRYKKIIFAVTTDNEFEIYKKYLNAILMRTTIHHNQ